MTRRILILSILIIIVVCGLTVGVGLFQREAQFYFMSQQLIVEDRQYTVSKTMADSKDVGVKYAHVNSIYETDSLLHKIAIMKDIGFVYESNNQLTSEVLILKYGGQYYYCYIQMNSPSI